MLQIVEIYNTIEDQPILKGYIPTDNSRSDIQGGTVWMLLHIYVGGLGEQPPEARKFSNFKALKLTLNAWKMLKLTMY